MVGSRSGLRGYRWLLPSLAGLLLRVLIFIAFSRALSAHLVRFSLFVRRLVVVVLQISYIAAGFVCAVRAVRAVRVAGEIVQHMVDYNRLFVYMICIFCLLFSVALLPYSFFVFVYDV
jgi:hypothetical protein